MGSCQLRLKVKGLMARAVQHLFLMAGINSSLILLQDANTGWETPHTPALAEMVMLLKVKKCLWFRGKTFNLVSFPLLTITSISVSALLQYRVQIKRSIPSRNSVRQRVHTQFAFHLASCKNVWNLGELGANSPPVPFPHWSLSQLWIMSSAYLWRQNASAMSLDNANKMQKSEANMVINLSVSHCKVSMQHQVWLVKSP